MNRDEYSPVRKKLDKRGLAESCKAQSIRTMAGALNVDFTPIKDSKVGELAAKFDIVLG